MGLKDAITARRFVIKLSAQSGEFPMTPSCLTAQTLMMIRSDRPGFAALIELGIHTPLRQASLKKDEIRALLKGSGFHKTAMKCSQPCLATRIPQGTPITLEALDRIREGEQLLKTLGFGFSATNPWRLGQNCS